MSYRRPSTVVPFIVLASEDHGKYEWVSCCASSQRVTDELSALREDVFTFVREEKKTNIEHFLDLIVMDFYVLNSSLQGNVDELKESCRSFVGAKSFGGVAMKLKAQEPFESLDFEALNGGERKGGVSADLEYKLIVVAHIPPAQQHDPRKRARVEEEEVSTVSTSQLDFFTDLHDMYWRRDLPNPTKTLTIIQSGMEHPDDDRNMDSPTTIPYIDIPFTGGIDKLMVRKDYVAAYQYLKSFALNNLKTRLGGLSGAVVCGHPGIGAHAYFVYNREC